MPPPPPLTHHLELLRLPLHLLETFLTVAELLFSERHAVLPCVVAGLDAAAGLLLADPMGRGEDVADGRLAATTVVALLVVGAHGGGGGGGGDSKWLCRCWRWRWRWCWCWCWC